MRKKINEQACKSEFAGAVLLYPQKPSKVAEKLVKPQEELAKVRQQLDTACEGRREALQDLLLHIVGFYEAKSDRAWNSTAAKARYGR